jgi:LPS-assembly lipoprotein
MATNPALRRFICAATLLLSAPLFAACGFTPLYGTSGAMASSQVVDAMAGIALRPITDRQGMKLRQSLRERLQPNGAARTSPYVLDVQLGSQVQQLGVRPDSTTSRANLIFIASFYLSEDGRQIFSNTVQSIVSYNILDDQYATVAAGANAEDRAIRQISDDIRTRIAVYFDARFAAQQATAR